MRLKVFNDKITLGRAAAEQAATAIRRAISERGEARIIAATAASQLEFLDALTKVSGIDWTKVEAFHLDEYIGIPITHPGSFRKMLMEQLVVKTGIRQYHLLAGDAAEPAAVVRQIGTQLASAPIDIAFLGIGENGHIAFNDPPADFNTEEPYIMVNLDEACRQQQVGEAWFADLSQVPKQALSMSAKQILKAKEILFRGRDQSHGTSFDFATPSQCDRISRHQLGLDAGPNLADSAAGSFGSHSDLVRSLRCGPDLAPRQLVFVTKFLLDPPQAN
jgi:glucosamine-6-phosphate deaminase